MTKETFLNTLSDVAADERKIAKVAARYKSTPRGLVESILSFADQTVFLDNGWRLLSLEEILDAPEDLHVDFAVLRLLPLFDCGDNNFVTYHLNDDSWSYYNINDGTTFKRRNSLQELMP